jgi:hypothetical protein
MISTSAAFKTAIDKMQRRTKGLIEFDFSQPSLTIPTYTATTTLDSTNMPVSALRNNYFRATDFIATGVIPKNIHKGWQSATTSNASGILSTPEVIVADYGKEVKHTNIWVVGQRSSYPVDFKIEVYKSGAWVLLQSVTGNTQWEWHYKYIAPTSMSTISRVRLTITKVSSPGSNARLMFFGMIGKIYFTTDDIQEFNILEEANAESSNPAGIVTSNELNIYLSNERNWFSLQNESSPFSGLIRPKISVMPYIGVETTPNAYEFVKMGHFFLEDWDALSDDMTASITCYGPLKSILNKPIPSLMPKKDISIKTVVEDLFRALGLGSWKYKVATSLDKILDINWYPQGNVGEFLQRIAESSLCSFQEDRDGDIVVVDNRTATAPVRELSADNQIINFVNKQTFNSTYPKVKLTYTKPSMEEMAEVASVKADSPSSATNWAIDDIKLTQPLISVDYALLENAATNKITGIIADQYNISVKVNSTSGVSEKVALKVYGTSINMQKLSVEVSDTELLSYWPDKVLEIETDYIQNIDDATSFANTILDFAKDPSNFYSVQLRGDPSIEILDTVTIKQSDALSILNDVNLVIIRQEIKFTGGLEVVQKLRRSIV